jgi:hypothetical protein
MMSLSLFFPVFETGSYYVAQAGPQLLGSSNPLASASQVAGTTGTCQHTQIMIYLKTDSIFSLMKWRSSFYFYLNWKKVLAICNQNRPIHTYDLSQIFQWTKIGGQISMLHMTSNKADTSEKWGLIRYQTVPEAQKRGDPSKQCPVFLIRWPLSLVKGRCLATHPQKHAPAVLFLGFCVEMGLRFCGL